MSCRSYTRCRRHCSRSPGTALVLTSSEPISTLHQRFTCVRLPGSHLTQSLPRLLNSSFTTATLNRRSTSRFAARPCRPTARDLPSSHTQLLLAHSPLGWADDRRRPSCVALCPQTRPAHSFLTRDR